MLIYTLFIYKYPLLIKKGVFDIFLFDGIECIQKIISNTIIRTRPDFLIKFPDPSNCDDDFHYIFYEELIPKSVESMKNLKLKEIFEID